MTLIDGCNRSLNSIEERINELGDRLEENIHTEAQEDRELENRERNVRGIWDM